MTDICQMGDINMSEYCKNCYKLAEENKELKEKFKQIKDIVKECLSGIECCNCKYAEQCNTGIEQALGVCKMIIELLEE